MNKYKTNDQVWMLDKNHRPQMFLVEEVDADDLEDRGCWYTVNDNGSWRQENQLYSTKQSLIEAQIKYWQSFSDEPQYCGVSGIQLRDR